MPLPPGHPSPESAAHRTALPDHPRDTDMHIHVLGAGAGGGFPQWNCNCANCAGYRAGTLRTTARTQSSIAVSADGTDWILFNASPDIRAQLAAFAPMQPNRGIRDTGICAVLLIDSQIDHATGLLMLREHTRRLPVYLSAPAQQDLSTGLPLLKVLEHYCGTEVHELPLDGAAFTIPGAAGLVIRTVALASKAPPYSPHRHDPHPGDNVGVFIEDTRSGGRLFYAPGLGEIEDHLLPYLEQADLLLVDGTFWTEDEMIRHGIVHKFAREMGHLPQSGEDGMIRALAPYRGRKVLIHINNTNPILVEDGPERAELAAHGIEVAYDGMDFEL